MAPGPSPNSHKRISREHGMQITRLGSSSRFNQQRSDLRFDGTNIQPCLLLGVPPQNVVFRFPFKAKGEGNFKRTTFPFGCVIFSGPLLDGSKRKTKRTPRSPFIWGRQLKANEPTYPCPFCPFPSEFFFGTTRSSSREFRIRVPTFF